MRSFYDLPAEERILMTEVAIARRSTLMQRWTALEAEGVDRWRRRAAKAAAWLRDMGATSVLDLGCGTMTLERHLTKSIAYIPCDVIRRDDRTLVCDLNTDPMPQVRADALACLGLIEYLLEPHAVLAALSHRHSYCVLSYNVTERQPEVAFRRSNGWVNDFSSSDVEVMLASCGWRSIRAERFGPGQHIWLARSAYL